MKTNEIPQEEKERIDFENLPQTIVMKATDEYLAEATEDKTGGLIINFETKDNKIVTQKYGKISGRYLCKALEKLGLQDTEELQEAFYKYVLTKQRNGFPRYIPIGKAD